MRWSIIRLIWARELRDQLRDRRTLFMIAVLPILLYPVAGFGVLQLAAGFLKQQNLIAVQGSDNLPPWTPRCTTLSPVPALSWFTLTPGAPGAPLAGLERATAAAALHHARRTDPRQDYPPLFLRQDRRDKPGGSQGNKLRFPTTYLDSPEDAATLVIQAEDGPTPPAPSVVPGTQDVQQMEAYLSQIDRRSLDGRLVDLLLVVPANFAAELEKNGRPPLYVLAREKDDRSRLVSSRVAHILGRWKKQLKDVRLVRKQLPAGYDDPFELRDPERAQPAGTRATEDLFDILVRVFPFVLVMWSLAGALYPAVDLCAGEKERGTMETLLISPASREEIVWGKFLTIWVFSAVTALLNLVSMGLTTWQFSSPLPQTGFRPSALFWGVALLLPLSAFFSAVCLAVGAYARSSKEGQYYLMPLFLLTMPLIFLTLAPGVELNPFYSMVPVTGVALLLQKLMAAAPDRKLWLYFLPVLAPMVVYSWLALRWAIEQFQREEVLFREAERLDIGLWLRHLLRDKEPLPSAGQALFCFGLIFFLGWITLSVAHPGNVLVQLGVRYLAFVAAPALFMALILTTRPRVGLALRLPPLWAWLAAPALALLLFLPAMELAYFILQQFPGLREAILREHQDALRGSTPLLGGQASVAARLQALLILAVLPALSEELAFRGFILTGLARRFRGRTAIFLSSFLFALAQMNVFQFIPHFVLGAVMALLVLRTGSVIPAIIFHLVHNGLVYAPAAFPEAFGGVVTAAASFSLPLLLLTALSAALAALLLARLVRNYSSSRTAPSSRFSASSTSAGVMAAQKPW